MTRLLAAAAGLLAGALLAVTGLIGTHAATKQPVPVHEPLMLDRYCDDRFGEGATVNRSRYLDGWSCGTWRNGVWGLEPVILSDVCRWQRGPDAELGGSGSSERALTCTL